METGPTGYSDFAPARSRLAEELLEALGEAPKRIPSKLLYDARGSQLFEQICELEEYYLTRTELSIMREHAPAMADALGERCLLVEFGSGAGTKTRLLLDALVEPTGYVPIDISPSALAQSAAQLERRYPDLAILPVCADYTGEYRIPEAPRAHDRISVYFPGSTLGNFTHREARHFLEHVAKLSGPGGGMLVGIDLDKDPRVLEVAYDDPGGVTAAFELNVLERLNRDFDADFRVESFAYRCFYEPALKRIEMYLVSLERQRVRVAGQAFEFGEREPVLIEYAHKFTLEGFEQLAAEAGFLVERVWTDPARHFSVQYLVTR
jgi:dimethylhistidine N-methyltransferase